MTDSNIETGMQKINLIDTFGKDNIIKDAKNISLKCIRIGHKKTWIKPVPSGGSMGAGHGSGILTSIRSIMHDIEKRFFIKRKYIIERRLA